MRWVAALVPLARTHMVMLSARAAVARADEAMSMAASAPQVVRVVMTFLPGMMATAAPIEKARPSRVGEKSFSQSLYRAHGQAARGCPLRQPAPQSRRRRFDQEAARSRGVDRGQSTSL